MRENMANVNFTAIKMNGCDESIFIAANIEDDPVIQFIGGGENRTQFGKTIEISFLHDLEPTQ